MSDKWDVPVMPYVDMPASRGSHTLSGYSKDTGITAFALAFVGTKEHTTDFTWAGNDASHFVSEVDDFRKNHSGVPVISFGGSGGEGQKWLAPEHWITDRDTLFKGYQGILESYHARHINFDFESHDSFKPVRERNAVLVSDLLQKHKDLRISYSLELDKEELRLDDFPIKLLKGLHEKKITPALVNVLIQYLPDWNSAKKSLESAHKSMVDIFGITSEDAWLRIGACPMYGTAGENNWTLEDHKKLVAFAKEKNIGCISGWSTNRDTAGYEYEKIQKGYQPKTK